MKQTPQKSLTSTKREEQHRIENESSHTSTSAYKITVSNAIGSDLRIHTGIIDHKVNEWKCGIKRVGPVKVC